MPRLTVEELLSQLESLPPSTKKQVLAQLKVICQREGILFSDTTQSATHGSCTSRGFVAAGIASMIILLVQMSGKQGPCPDCVCKLSGIRKLVTSIDAMEERSPKHSNLLVDVTKLEGHARSDSLPKTQSNAQHISRNHYPPHPAFDTPREAIARLKPARRTSNFPLLVCVGHGKTATKSLNKALVMLGMNTAHFYGAGVYNLLFDNAAEQLDKEFLFNVNEERHVAAVLDTPVVDFYNEIALAYPNARFILTVRDPQRWIRSQQKFYANYARGCKNWLAPWRRGSNIVYGTECPSPVQAIKRYHQHNRNVFDALPRDRLLIMDIPGGDGWEKLCPFLGLPVPDNRYGNMTFPNRH